MWADWGHCCGTQSQLLSVSVSSDPAPAQHPTALYCWDSLSATNYVLYCTCLPHSSRGTESVKARCWLFVVIIALCQDLTFSSWAVFIFIKNAIVRTKSVILLVINGFKHSTIMFVLDHSSIVLRYFPCGLLTTRWCLICYLTNGLRFSDIEFDSGLSKERIMSNLKNTGQQCYRYSVKYCSLKQRPSTYPGGQDQCNCYGSRPWWRSYQQFILIF